MIQGDVTWVPVGGWLEEDEVRDHVPDDLDQKEG